MKVEHLDNMVKGWFVGDFNPVVFPSKDIEVAVKSYKAGDYEAPHYHKVATEITVIVSGEALMANRNCKAGDILTLEPGFITDFKAITDVVTVVVKSPSAKDDKYVV
ncbi:hypothetical protein [Agitococcus lubricus]|uniref:Cupin domain n=1 Tax=Agitococcus lubricus TaxID=1077255 RepID=A0A2T5J163_9GAMM|nr:hypothetical protein [Agitococcus lubricus]PTQ90039.1 hypothetical protein C8N29_10477 [Agitococcus lubricus]